jgi:hypothetical protein
MVIQECRAKSNAKGDNESVRKRPMCILVFLYTGDEFPNRTQLMRAVNGASQMGLRPAQGDAYCKSADDPSDPIFSIRGKATTP